MKKIFTLLAALICSTICAGQTITTALSTYDNNEPLKYQENYTEPNEPIVLCPTDTAQVNNAYAFIFTVQFGDNFGSYIIPYYLFSWNENQCSWTYTLGSPVTIYAHEVTPPYGEFEAATLTDFTARFKLGLPYMIKYNYTIILNEVQGYETGIVSVESSPILVPEGQYQGRILAVEGGRELNNDNWFQKNAIGQGQYDPPGYNSMEYFYTDSTTEQFLFQRGYAWLSCDSNNCSISAGLQYPTAPDYFEIELDDIIMFYIEHSFEGSIGDRFNATESFTITEL